MDEKLDLVSKMLEIAQTDSSTPPAVIQDILQRTEVSPLIQRKTEKAFNRIAALAEIVEAKRSGTGGTLLNDQILELAAADQRPVLHQLDGQLELCVYHLSRLIQAVDQTSAAYDALDNLSGADA